MIWNFFKRKTKASSQPESGENQKNDATSFKPITPLPTSEELCEINPETMNKDEIRTHLKILYKRHNEAAASLNKELRNEAEKMLDAIVDCRNKYVDS
jgi:hypothetical protein